MEDRSLKPRSDVDAVPDETEAVGHHIANIDADAETDGSIGGLVSIVGWHLLLHLHSAAHRLV